MYQRVAAISMASLMLLAGCGVSPTAIPASTGRTMDVSAAGETPTVAAPPNKKAPVRQANFDVFDAKKESLDDISNVVIKNVWNSRSQQHFFFEFDIKVADTTEKRMMTVTFGYNANRIFVTRQEAPKNVSAKELARVFRLSLESGTRYDPMVYRVINDMVTALAGL